MRRIHVSLSFLVLFLPLWSLIGNGQEQASPAEDGQGLASSSQGGQERATPFQDEPEAHELYDEMVEAMGAADSLSWTSDYSWEAQGNTLGHATYKIWLKKPNYARVEARHAGSHGISGVLVGDGDYFWIYWPEGKPRYQWEYQDKYREEYEKHEKIYYMKKRTPPGQHSIGHETGRLGAGMSMTILDPSTFHGYTDSLQPYLDGVRSLGEELVGGEDCHVIEVSFMKYQRSWKMWLSKKDHLPRRLDETVRVSYDILVHETWSDVTVNGEMPEELFAWSPGEGWKEWDFPPIEEGLLAPGTAAPGLEGVAVDGKKLKLSDYLGKVVWLYKWRCG